MLRRQFIVLAGASALGSLPFPALAATDPREPLFNWYRMMLELVRHTATYSPPVASRAFGYMGVAGYEAAASGIGATSLAGQLNGLTALRAREPGAHDEALVLHAALSAMVKSLFSNTGPTGQRAMAAMDEKLGAKLRKGLAEDVAARSDAYGASVARHILSWSLTDGGATVANMGFPLKWSLAEGPSHWAPTNLIVQQQAPLLPEWGNNRPFAMPMDAVCGLPAPLDYSEDPASAFYKQAMEVYDTSKSLTDEQKKIARFWSDDPMLSPTPPGHWISITLQVLQAEGSDLAQSADTLARVGMAVADGFIACWKAKFQYDILRPVTYIKRVIDKKWEPLLNTPPFPEYPSGHSTQSGAAAEVLTAIFGDAYAFEDATHADDNIPARSFGSFREAAVQAAQSRLYGGIHFRGANENGLVQGNCVGGHVNNLKTLG